MSNPVLSAALEYAARLGWRLFPVGSDCRGPLVKGGCHSASSDPERLKQMFGRSANVALACGEASGVFALDVDVKGEDGMVSLAALERLHGVLPETWRSETPSGGRHIFFRQPRRSIRNRVGFAPGLDVRTSGGSVALPPSTRAEGSYRWLASPWSAPLADAPAWLLTLIDPPAPPLPPAKPLRVNDLSRAARYVCAAVNGECAELASMKAGTGRNHRLFVAAARLGGLVGADLLSQSAAEDALERAAAECGLSADDGHRSVRATIKSGIGRGLANPREVAA